MMRFRMRLVVFVVVVSMYGGGAQGRAFGVETPLALVQGKAAVTAFYIAIRTACPDLRVGDCINRGSEQLKRLVIDLSRAVKKVHRTDERARASIVQSICERLQLMSKNDCRSLGALLITGSEEQIRAGFGPPKIPRPPHFGGSPLWDSSRIIKEHINTLREQCRTALSNLAQKEKRLKEQISPSTTKSIKELQIVQEKIKKINKICTKYASYDPNTGVLPELAQLKAHIKEVKDIFNAQQHAVVQWNQHRIVPFTRKQK